MGVAVVYTGERRFEKQGRENHRFLWQELSEFISFKIIDKCKDNRNDDQFELSGPNQIWDFYKALDTIEEDIIIKVRPDAWFTKSSIKYVVNEILSVVNGSQNMCLIGTELREHYNKEYTKYNLVEKCKTGDYLIVLNKKILKPKQEVFDWLKNEGSKSGNILWKFIAKDFDKCSYVFCNSYLLRHDYPETPSDEKVAYDFAYGYGTFNKGKIKAKASESIKYFEDKYNEYLSQNKA